MKKILFTVLCAVSLLSFVPTSGDEANIEFNTGTWKWIVAEAKAKNKLIFLDAYASWCGPCKWAEKNVFTQKEIADYYNKTFINASIDMEKGDGIALSKKFHIESYPTFLILNSKEEIISRMSGVQYNKKFYGTFLQFGKNAQQQ